MKHLILASSSPRRRELLKEAVIDFEIAKSSYIEASDENLSPEDLVLKHAIGKAKGVLSRYKDGIILGADTIVVLGEKIIGKPKDDNDAKNILKNLSGKTHQVLTGFALIDAKSKKIKTRLVVTDVEFKVLSDAQIIEYLKSGEHVDKAGAYSYQGNARAFVSKVSGSQTNVIGLPMDELIDELKKFS